MEMFPRATINIVINVPKGGYPLSKCCVQRQNQLQGPLFNSTECVSDPKRGGGHLLSNPMTNVARKLIAESDIDAMQLTLVRARNFFETSQFSIVAAQNDIQVGLHDRQDNAAK